jgi:hypothetical protein
MTNSTTNGARVHITAEYLSEDEPLGLFRVHYVKSSRNRISAPGEGRHMRMPTLNEIKSQTDQAHGNHLEKPCTNIGQKSDKAKCKSLKQELLNCEGKVLQNLYSAVRSRPAPPSFYTNRSNRNYLRFFHSHSRSAPVKFSTCPSDIQTGVLELPAKPNCEQRNKLAEVLVELAVKLSIAASQMAEFADGDVAAFEKAKTEVQQLRDECENTRVDLYRHRAQHGC